MSLKRSPAASWMAGLFELKKLVAPNLTLPHQGATWASPTTETVTDIQSAADTVAVTLLALAVARPDAAATLARLRDAVTRAVPEDS